MFFVFFSFKGETRFFLSLIIVNFSYVAATELTTGQVRVFFVLIEKTEQKHENVGEGRRNGEGRRRGKRTGWWCHSSVLWLRGKVILELTPIHVYRRLFKKSVQDHQSGL